MIYQMQHQFKDGTTEMKMQREFKKSDEKKWDFACEFISEAKKEFPLPEGVQWFLCSDEHPRFKWTVADEPNEIV